MSESKNVRSMVQERVGTYGLEAIDTFALGAGAGGVSVILKGMYDSAKGNSWKGGMEAFDKNFVRVNKYAALATGVLCTVDCTMKYVRQKDDGLNKIMAAALSAGLFTVRHRGLGPGTRSFMLSSALIGVFFSNELY